MIRAAQRLSPQIKFETGDLLNIIYPSGSFGSVLAFYAIVHFTNDQIKKCFEEMNRVLRSGGDFLFSFHVGDEIVHFDKAHDKEIDIDLFFSKTDDIVELLYRTGFDIVDALERRPYEAVAYPSRRAYIWSRKK